MAFKGQSCTDLKAEGRRTGLILMRKGSHTHPPADKEERELVGADCSNAAKGTIAIAWWVTLNETLEKSSTIVKLKSRGGHLVADGVTGC